MSTVYVKVPIKQVPKEKGWFLLTYFDDSLNRSSVFYFDGKEFQHRSAYFTHWLHPVELPSEEEIRAHLNSKPPYPAYFNIDHQVYGANYVLSLLEPKDNKPF